MFNSIWLYAVAALLATTLLFGGLLYREIGKTAEAEQALATVIDANTSLQKSLDLKDSSCKIDDTISTERQEEKALSDKAKDSELSAIDNIPISIKTPLTPLPTSQGITNESNVVDIDGKLPESLRLLLSQSYNRAKGRVSDTAGQPSN